jgi:hypothetical protein
VTVTSAARSLSLLLGVAAACGDDASAGREAAIHVSTAGRDDGAGTKADPFRTVVRAQQEVRARNADMTADLEVRIAPGAYELDAPLVLTELDSGSNGYRVIYRSDGAPGSARLIGGRRITEWRSVAGPIVAAHVPFGFHTLYEDGVRADEARHPDRAPAPAFPLSHAPYMVSVGGSSTVLQYSDAMPEMAGDLSGVNVLIWPFAGRAWFTDIVPVRAIDRDTRSLHLAQTTRYEIGAGARFVLRGSASLISAPGEYFYDAAASTLYYWPRASDVARTEIIAPAMTSIVTIRGASPQTPVHDIELHGLWLDATDFTEWYRFGVPTGTFERQIEMEGNRVGLVTMENTERVDIASSRLSNSGYGGIYMLFHNQHDRIYGNLIEHTGINGITLQGGFPGTGDVSRDNIIANNRIHHVGELAGNAAGIDISNSGFNTIANNWIHDSPRYGVIIHAIAGVAGDELYAQGNVVERTRIERTCQDSGDTAPIYAIGVAADGTAARQNTFRQLVIAGAIADPSMRDIAPNGVFLDFDTPDQIFEDIVVTDVAGEPYRALERVPQTFTNVSWLPGFDASRIDTGAIGVTADFPATYRP